MRVESDLDCLIAKDGTLYTAVSVNKEWHWQEKVGE